jgi:hypothetical protein
MTADKERAAPAHAVADAHAHASQTGNGSRAAIPARPAPKFVRRRTVKVHFRGPFLPDHHGHHRHGLIAKDTAK